MAESTLAQRIKTEFDARTQRIMQSAEDRAGEKRMAKFNAACQDLSFIVQPRAEDSAAWFLRPRITRTPATELVRPAISPQNGAPSHVGH